MLKHLLRAGMVLASEYGIGSAVDLCRAMRNFEQRGATGLEDAQYVRDKLDRFLADWNQWRMAEAFGRPEDFFMESLKKMAGQRTLGLSAIRSNPRIIGHSLTAAIDEVLCGEGLTTLFRELKPGTVDALFDAWRRCGGVCSPNRRTSTAEEKSTWKACWPMKTF